MNKGTIIGFGTGLLTGAAGAFFFVKRACEKAFAAKVEQYCKSTDEVLGELTAENVELKKKLNDIESKLDPEKTEKKEEPAEKPKGGEQVNYREVTKEQPANFNPERKEVTKKMNDAYEKAMIFEIDGEMYGDDGYDALDLFAYKDGHVLTDMEEEVTVLELIDMVGERWAKEIRELAEDENKDGTELYIRNERTMVDYAIQFCYRDHDGFDYDDYINE